MVSKNRLPTGSGTLNERTESASSTIPPITFGSAATSGATSASFSMPTMSHRTGDLRSPSIAAPKAAAVAAASASLGSASRSLQITAGSAACRIASCGGVRACCGKADRTANRASAGSVAQAGDFTSASTSFTCSASPTGLPAVSTASFGPWALIQATSTQGARAFFASCSATACRSAGSSGWAR